MWATPRLHKISNLTKKLIQLINSHLIVKFEEIHDSKDSKTWNNLFFQICKLGILGNFEPCLNAPDKFETSYFP